MFCPERVLTVKLVLCAQNCVFSIILQCPPVLGLLQASLCMVPPKPFVQATAFCLPLFAVAWLFKS